MFVAYDDVLVGRVRELASPELFEKNVFGARCWMHAGNMAFGVTNDDFLVRLGSESPESAGLKPFDPLGSGKPMANWFLVAGDDVAEDEELAEWMGRAVAFTATLPPK